MSQPSSSAPAFKSDVRVKMLQTEVSVLQQKLRDMESENRQTMQRLQRTLELSWKKDLKSIHEVMQRRQENSLSVACVDESPNAKVPASSIVASGCSNDVVNGQIRNLALQIHSLKERLDQHVARPSYAALMRESPDLARHSLVSPLNSSSCYGTILKLLSDSLSRSRQRSKRRLLRK
jgi:hypothetical protein